MNNFILTEIKKQKIVKLDINKSYVIEDKKNNRIINVYDKDVMQRLSNKDLFRQYQKLLNYIKSIMEDDTSGAEEFQKCLDRIEKFKQILEVKYKSLIKREIYKKYLESLIELSKYYNNKIIEYNQINVNNKTR